MTTSTPTTQHVAPSSLSSSTSPSAPSVGSPRRGRAPMSVVVAGSLAVGFLAAAALVAAPVVPVTESALTGAVLCGFAIGWAVLAALSTRFTTQPQRWALVPAVVLGASGIILLALGSSAHPAVDWVWPLVLLALALWMAVHIHRDLHSRAARWLLYPAVGAMGLAAVGGAYQAVGAVADASSSSMPGRLVDVGGHRLHLNCTGTGSPTVVVEAGGGEMAANLGWVTPVVARDTTICVYDRAGRGWSEDADTPQDALAISTDLHTLLHRAGVPGPYVMAGHSFGGLYALTFAAHHPDDVAGMVLIDSTSPRYDEVDGATAHPAPPGPTTSWVGSPPPPPRWPGWDWAGCSPRSPRLTSRLGNRLRCRRAPRRRPPCAARSRSTRGRTPRWCRRPRCATSANKPLMVLSAGVGSAADWPQKQERLAALSTDSVHRVVDGASHEALVGEETHAATTSRAILEVVSAVRTGQPLSR